MDQVLWRLIVSLALCAQVCLGGFTASRNAAEDAEEKRSGGNVGNILLGSDDLEIGSENQAQLVCIRFNDIPIGRAQVVDDAYLRLTAKSNAGNGLGDVELRCHGERKANPASFSDTAGDLSSRELTGQSVFYRESRLWNTNQKFDSPSLRGIVQEIVNLDDWQFGSSMVICCGKDNVNDGENTFRQAFSVDSSGKEPELLLSFQTLQPTTSPTDSPTTTDSPTAAPVVGEAPPPVQAEDNFDMGAILAGVGGFGLAMMLGVRRLRSAANKRKTLRLMNAPRGGGIGGGNKDRTDSDKSIPENGGGRLDAHVSIDLGRDTSWSPGSGGGGAPKFGAPSFLAGGLSLLRAPTFFRGGGSTATSQASGLKSNEGLPGPRGVPSFFRAPTFFRSKGGSGGGGGGGGGGSTSFPSSSPRGASSFFRAPSFMQGGQSMGGGGGGQSPFRAPTFLRGGGSFFGGASKGGGGSSFGGASKGGGGRGGRGGGGFGMNRGDSQFRPPPFIQESPGGAPW